MGDFVFDYKNRASHFIHGCRKVFLDEVFIILIPELVGIGNQKRCHKNPEIYIYTISKVSNNQPN